MNKPASKADSSPKKRRSKESGKTTVLSVLSLLESLTLAVLLALVFRGFVVEAFVIPTGSMAETLLGIHGETICPNCRQVYSTSIPPNPISNPYCPNCRAVVPGREVLGRGQAGDRVLVLKPMYFLSRYKGLEWLGPKRWDVAVFLFPGNGQENYIKRITGLPGESIEVIGGDIYINGQIARKPHSVQEELWITVYENDYQEQKEDLPDAAWQEVSGRIERPQMGRVLRVKAKGRAETLVYKRVIDNRLAYNAFGREGIIVTVSDLRLSFDVIGREFSQTSEVTAVLSKGNRQFRLRLGLRPEEAVIELQSRYAGQAGAGQTYWRNERDEQGTELRHKLGAIGLGQAVHLQLQNVDYRVSVWVDGEEVLATTQSSYGPGPTVRQIRESAPSREVNPYVAMGAKDCEVDLLHIKLDRDVYYTSSQRITVPRKDLRQDAVAAKLDGQRARACGKPFMIPPRGDQSEPAYFLMGDNSSSSLDSRLWWSQHAGLGVDYVRGSVPRSHMIGQAFSGYWIPELGRKPQLVPRVSKVRLIR